MITKIAYIAILYFGSITHISAKNIIKESNKLYNISTDFIWSNSEFEKKYKKYLRHNWKKINSQSLAGFNSIINITERKTPTCIRYNGYHKHQYLRKSGGMCQFGYWLEKENGEIINSKDQLIETFGPINSKAKAISFIVTLYDDLQINAKNNIPRGSILEIKEQDNSVIFLVQLVKKNHFGCGSHINIPSKIIFMLTNDAKIQIIAKEKTKTQNPNKPIICVD